jgi:hypothetical protein
MPPAPAGGFIFGINEHLSIFNFQLNVVTLRLKIYLYKGFLLLNELY